MENEILNHKCFPGNSKNYLVKWLFKENYRFTIYYIERNSVSFDIDEYLRLFRDIFIDCFINNTQINKFLNLQSLKQDKQVL